MARRAASFLLVIVVLLGAAAVSAYYWIDREYHAAGPARANLLIDIDPGSSVRAVLARLAERGAIRDARLTEVYLRLHRQQPSIKAGRYEIPAGASAAKILELLEQGVVVLEQLTIVEGSTFADLRRALEKHPAITVTLRGKSNAEVMSAIGHAGEHPEGRFFPDTYRFAARTTDVELLKLAYINMQRVLDGAWAQRDPTIPIKTPYEALILASVIEKETGLASERPMIAGVFTARLKRGMRLQSDPTVIYGIGEKYDGNIRSRDLTTDTPYNTYTRGGLPPTPIALPGRESVLAAVEPLDTGALFFVATGDGTGAHYFSKTLEEHNEAVRRYLIRFRRQNRP
jgi:UPF0755 protein